MLKQNNTILDHYEKNEFDYWGFSVVEKGFSIEEKKFIDLLVNKNSKILDIGCGGGRLSLGLYKLGFSRITGMDFSFKFCSVYNNRFVDLKKEIFGINASAVALPFNNGVFDYVLCLGNLLSFLSKQHDRVSALKEIERVLAPGGIVVVSVLYFSSRPINYLLYQVLRLIRTFQNSPPERHNLPWLKKAGKPNFKLCSQNEPQAYWFTKKEFISELDQTSLRQIALHRKIANGVPLLCALQKK